MWLDSIVNVHNIRKGENKHMKIMVQNRSVIMDMPRNIWVATEGKNCNGLILCGSSRNPVIGLFENATRAKEVLNEIFEFQRNGTLTYLVPEK